LRRGLLPDSLSLRSDVRANRTIGQEARTRDQASRSDATLDRRSSLIDWQPVAALLAPLYPAAKGEPAWPPLAMFKAVTAQLEARAVTVKTGTLVDATIIAPASKGDEAARWVKHRNRGSIHGFKAHLRADADTALVEAVSVTPADVHDGREGPAALPDAPGQVCADRAYRVSTSGARCVPRAACRGSP
jgi:hypothetical protein